MKRTVRCAAWGLVWLLVSHIVNAEAWVSEYQRDHPLVGRIWNAAHGEWIEQSVWLNQISRSDILLLGETHTNIDHHRLQARVVEFISRQGTAPVVAFEMFGADQRIDALSSAAKLSEAVQFAAELSPHWPWSAYKPLLAAIRHHRISVIGANLNPLQRDAVASSDSARISDGFRYVDINGALNETQRWQLGELINEAHCGYVQADRLPRSVDIQIARDISFALTLARENDRKRSVVLVAGSGHVRKDIGVPMHLRRLGMVSTSVVFVPVEADRLDVSGYLPPGSAIMYDYLYFTPNDRALDPCVEFQEQLKQLGKSR